MRALALPLALLPALVLSQIPLGDPSRSATYAFKDLPADYLPVVVESGSNASPFGDLSPYYLFGIAGTGSNQNDLWPFELMSVVFTKGEYLEGSGGRYLVAYRTFFTDLIRSTNKTSENPTRTSQPDLEAISVRLTFIRADSIASVTPRPDLTYTALKERLSTAKPAGNYTETASNLKQIALATLVYSADYDDLYPYAQSTAQATKFVMPYAKNRDLFRNPNPDGGRLLYNVRLSGVPGTALKSPAEVVLWYEERPSVDGKRGVAYADGHVKRVPEDTFRRQFAYRPPRGR